MMSRRNRVAGEGKAVHVQAHYSPRGFHEIEASRFLDSQHMKVVRLSAQHL